MTINLTMIYLYICLNNDDIDSDLILKAADFVSVKRKEKALCLRNIVDQKNSLAVFLMLKKGLKEQYGVDEFDIEYGVNGKPYLKNMNIHFNMSHCKSASVVALCDKEIGVDVQEIRNVNEGILRHTCNLKERDLIQDSNELFTKIWTIKEACLKKNSGRVFDVIDIDTTIINDYLTMKIDDVYLTICSDDIKNENIIKQYTNFVSLI